jgi:hypothetical protein
VAAGLQMGGDVVPDRPIEPQSGDQQDVHLSSPSPSRSGPLDAASGFFQAPTINTVPDDWLPD